MKLYFSAKKPLPKLTPPPGEKHLAKTHLKTPATETHPAAKKPTPKKRLLGMLGLASLILVPVGMAQYNAADKHVPKTGVYEIHDIGDTHTMELVAPGLTEDGVRVEVRAKLIWAQASGLHSDHIDGGFEDRFEAVFRTAVQKELDKLTMGQLLEFKDTMKTALEVGIYEMQQPHTPSFVEELQSRGIKAGLHDIEVNQLGQRP